VIVAQIPPAARYFAYPDIEVVGTGGGFEGFPWGTGREG
jgi:hypothetical protein